MAEHRTPIKCYVSAMGRNKIRDWYEGLTQSERAYTDTFLENMQRLAQWGWPEYRQKLRNCDGMGELRWPCGNKAHRLIGYFEQGCWVAVIGCTHKQNIYDPAAALETAKRRRREIASGEAKVVRYDI